jgi:hypothetical protein
VRRAKPGADEGICMGFRKQEALALILSGSHVSRQACCGEREGQGKQSLFKEAV